MLVNTMSISNDVLNLEGKVQEFVPLINQPIWLKFEGMDQERYAVGIITAVNEREKKVQLTSELFSDLRFSESEGVRWYSLNEFNEYGILSSPRSHKHSTSVSA